MKILRFSTSIVLLFLLAGWPRPASADRVARLTQILRTDSSYKVRLRVVITLSNIHDARVPAALMRALNDRHHLVRGLSAKALAQIGARRALRKLRRMSRHDRHHFARRSAARAAAHLAQLAAKPPRLYVKVGRLRNRARTGGGRVSKLLQRALIDEFERVPGVTTKWTRGRPTDAALLKRKMKGFMISGTIQRLTRRRAGPDMEIQCKIRVELSTYPGNSMKAFYSGEASMAVASRSNSREFLDSLYREIFTGAAHEACNHIMRSFLSTQ